MENFWKSWEIMIRTKNPAEVILKEERVRQWLAKGAKPTLTVSQLLEKKGIRV